MEKYFYLILTLISCILQGCNKDDDSIIGTGTIHYDGHIYQLHNATKTTSKSNLVAIIDEYVLHIYTHKLHFSSADNKNDITVLIGHTQGIPVVDENARIGYKTIELLSGDCFPYSISINTLENNIQTVLNLKLADEKDNENLWFLPKMNLVYEKKNNVYEIELNFVNNEIDFFLKWEGRLKEL